MNMGLRHRTFFLKKKIYLFIMCTMVCLHVSLQTEVGTRSYYRWLWATVWLLGIELRTSGRTVNVLNHWAISPAPFFFSYLWSSAPGLKNGLLVQVTPQKHIQSGQDFPTYCSVLWSSEAFYFESNTAYFLRVHSTAYSEGISVFSMEALSKWKTEAPTIRVDT